MSPPVQPILTILPSGQLHLRQDVDAAALAPALTERLAMAFAGNPIVGLVRLGAKEVATALPPGWAWWRDLAVQFLTALRRQTEADAAEPPAVVTAPSELATLLLRAPPLPGGEYLDPEVLAGLWQEMLLALHTVAAAEADGDSQRWLAAQHPSWHALGRVHLNLAEHKQDPALPFAFVATYTARLSAAARPTHLPLGRAVKEAAASPDKTALLTLLQPLQRAAAQSPWLAEQVASGRVYSPLRWPAEEAFAFLQQVPVLEAAGLIVRMPQSWQRGRPARPQVTATVDQRNKESLGAKSLLDFSVGLTLDGTPLTAAEAKTLLAGIDGLQLLRGQWIEVDRGRLQRILDHYQAVEAQAKASGLTFQEAMRLLAGVPGSMETSEQDAADWSAVTAGPALAQALAELRSPQGHLAPADPGQALAGLLRPYQVQGVGWLHLLVRLGLGACLADDMGLGKTLQVLALARTLQRQGPLGQVLVVMPASLLGNWQQEVRRFAPELSVRVAHGSAAPGLGWQPSAAADLVLTTYGTVARDSRLREVQWRLCVIDEAQAIKNPGAGQTRAVKQLQAQAKIAMTGTPVENRLGDLWSLMDFLNPGLLGTAAAFGKLCKQLDSAPDGYAPLRKLVQPYLLRRRKTDKSVIADLPDKTELLAYCGLSRLQTALYQQAVDALKAQLTLVDGIARRGAVLASLMRFKQICNHPSHWLGDGGWQPEHSGKFSRLREIAEAVSERQDKLLVFTQFKETIAPIQAFLQGVFGRPGLVLHGGTPVSQRQGLVARFQADPDVPFFVLSLKAGGTGLNLTAASQVVHFDRWWNPAVEDQATDRAFRIGQKSNVLVHKFVCRGTVEERIESLMASKRSLADAVLAGGAEVSLTELSDSDLIAMVRLDLASVASDDG